MKNRTLKYTIDDVVFIPATVIEAKITKNYTEPTYLLKIKGDAVLTFKESDIEGLKEIVERRKVNEN